MDGLWWWYLNLVATGISISVSYFIIVWEVSEACILIVDNGNELHHCSQSDTKILHGKHFIQYCHTSMHNSDCTMHTVLSLSQKMSLLLSSYISNTL